MEESAATWEPPRFKVCLRGGVCQVTPGRNATSCATCWWVVAGRACSQAALEQGRDGDGQSGLRARSHWKSPPPPGGEGIATRILAWIQTLDYNSGRSFARVPSCVGCLLSAGDSRSGESPDEDELTKLWEGRSHGQDSDPFPRHEDLLATATGTSGVITSSRLDPACNEILHRNVGRPGSMTERLWSSFLLSMLSFHH